MRAGIMTAAFIPGILAQELSILNAECSIPRE
jgi:hypothetical protein